MHVVADPLDPAVDPYRALKGRESREVLWAEGPTVVARLLTSTLRTRSLLVTPAILDRLVDTVSIPAGVELLVAERSVIAEIVGFDLHRGAIAIADRPPLATVHDVIATARRLVMVEGVNDAENLGAIARSARGLGADALVIDPTCADPFYRRSVRVSMGELLHLPVARADDWTAALDLVAAAGIEILALTPRADATSLHEVTASPRIAVLVGAEGPGLAPATLARTRNVRIPMHHGVDSLNVGHAVAAALAITQQWAQD